MIDCLLKSFIDINNVVPIRNKHSRNAVSSTTLVDMLDIGHFLDISRDSVTVIDTVENNWQIPDRSHIDHFVEDTFVGCSVPKVADDNLTSLFHLLSKGSTYCNTHTTTNDPVSTKVTSIEVSDMHGATLPFTSTRIFPQDFCHHAIQIDSFSNGLSVTTVVRCQQIIVV